MIRFQTNVGHHDGSQAPDGSLDPAGWTWMEGQVVDLPDVTALRKRTTVTEFTQAWSAGRTDPAPAAYRTVVIAQDEAGDFTDIVLDVTHEPDPQP